MADPTPATAAATDGIDLPAQVEQVSREIFRWVRTDSIGAAIGVAEGVVLYFVLLGARLLLKRWLGSGNPVTSWRGMAQRMVDKTGSFFLASFAAWVVAHLAAPPGTIRAAIDVIFTIAAIVQAAIWARVLLIAAVERRAANEEDAAAIDSAMGVIKVMINVVVWVIATIVVLDNLGVNVTALIAGLGVGGIAIGLAAQGIFADLFAALSILFDRPFRVGDTITFGNPQTTGTVEAIGLKTTRIRALSGEQVIVSNTNLLNQQIGNLRRIEQRRVVQTMYLALDTPAAALPDIPAMARAAIDGLDNTRFDRAHVSAVTLDAIEIEIVYHITVSDFDVLMNARQAVLLAMLERLDADGIGLAERAPPASAPPPVPAALSPRPAVKAADEVGEGTKRPRKAAG